MHVALKPLETEITAFKQQLPNLRQRFPIGTYVLFIGTTCVGSFTSYREALKYGYAERGLDPFLVKQISREGEDAQHVYSLPH